MKKINFALSVTALLFSNACATQPCSKQDFRGKSVFGIKFDGKNELVIDEKMGPATYQIETPDSSFLIAIPNALESPEPQFELANGTETVKLKASCGSWNQYNPYGHTWHARMNLPKVDGYYKLCVTFPDKLSAALVRNCSTNVSLKYSFDEANRKREAQRRKKQKASN